MIQKSTIQTIKPQKLDQTHKSKTNKRKRIIFEILKLKYEMKKGTSHQLTLTQELRSDFQAGIL